MPAAKKSVSKKTSGAKTGAKSESNVKLSKKTVVEEKPVVEAKPEPVVEASTVQNEVVEEGPSLHEEMAAFMTHLQSAVSALSALKTEYRLLEKRISKDFKTAQKGVKGRKKKQSNVNRQPSGFVKPTQISTELATFLGKDKGSEMARTEVTREINKYIRANNLQDPSNGRVIRADGKLRKLLKLNKSDELTYFNLQKYMSPHFPKPATTTSA